MTRKRLNTGKRGEDLAAEYLQNRGYSLVERNYRCTLGELDIIVRRGSTLIFVEVRTRSSNSFGSPLESVDRRKQARLRRMALYYLQDRAFKGVEIRFDVVAVLLEGANPVIDHLEGAF